MSPYKTALIVSISTICLILTVSLCPAATVTQQDGLVPTSSSTTAIVKTTAFIKKIQNNTLYLENKQKYNLNNVKVTDLSGSGHRVSKKKTAEMLFINGQLTEIVIR
ncbi:MAG: hypothetical protein JXA41_09755 [Deltaproteobacteria bacterium]|nr:hypothetical protein [Deltaproteobacteria bacterium]